VRMFGFNPQSPDKVIVTKERSRPLITP